MSASKNLNKIEQTLAQAKQVNIALARASREHNAASKQVDTLKKRLEGAMQALAETTTNLEVQLKAAVASQKAMEAARSKLAPVKPTAKKAPVKTEGKKSLATAGAKKVADKTASAPAKAPRVRKPAAPKANKPVAKKAATKKTSTPIGAASGKGVTSGTQTAKAAGRGIPRN